MSVSSIIDKAIANARRTAGAEKTASAEGSGDLVKEAHQLADALEFVALTSADDGTAAGTLRRNVVADFFKQAADHPAESIAPTGTQKDVPAAGAKKILPVGLAGGSSPAESGAPTGSQAMVDQTGTKKANQPMTLFDMLTQKNADGPSNSPVQSIAGQNAAPPPKKNEGSNVDRILGSNAGAVSATKRDAHLPTRARLKELFASASDTGPSSAAAQAAFPNAYAKGGMKVASEDEPEKRKPSAAKHLLGGAAIGGGAGAALGGTAGALGGVGLAHLGNKRMLAAPFGPEAIARSLPGTMTHVPYSKTVAGLVGGHGAGAAGLLGGAALGTGVGALALAHARSKARAEAEKKGSISEYAGLYDMMRSGELGAEAKAFADHIEQVELG